MANKKQPPVREAGPGTADLSGRQRPPSTASWRSLSQTTSAVSRYAGVRLAPRAGPRARETRARYL
jgi:hypothetical protein